MAVEKGTPRRSKRFQPIPEHNVNSNKRVVKRYAYEWRGQSLHTRATDQRDLESDLDDELMEDLETVFYNGLVRMTPNRAGLTTYGKKGKQKVAQESGFTEEFKRGDTVLLHTTSRLPSVGVLTAMWEIRDPGGKLEHDDSNLGMKIQVHWFLRPTELPRVRAKREHLENELYYSLAKTAILTPAHIIGHCEISSRLDGSNRNPSTSSRNHPNNIEEDPSNMQVQQNSFFCNASLDPQRNLYYKLDWEEHVAFARSTTRDDDSLAWNIITQEAELSSKREVVKRHIKKISPEPDSESEASAEDFRMDDYGEAEESDTTHESHASDDGISVDEEEDNEAMRTPTRKRKTRSAPIDKTPRKVNRTIAVPTPHSKAALRARAKKKKRFNIRPPLPSYESEVLQKLPDNPKDRVLHVLHVGARPDVLPCRDEEYADVLGSILTLLEEGIGGCVYISGVPGTGKTATVYTAVRELKEMAQRNETNPFTYVEINGLKLPEAPAAYRLLWEAVSNYGVTNEEHLAMSNKEALKNLNKHFGSKSGTGPGAHPCVVLMDELDQLMTTKQDVVYNFFNWPSMPGSKLIVIAVANTHDLPERTMTGRVRSRLGMTRINFKPYSADQLQEIVIKRLDSTRVGWKHQVPDFITEDAIKFASKKVASISGDARRVLDICRRAVETVLVPTESNIVPRAVSIPDVKKVIDAMQNSPTAAYLRDCTLHERIMLASMLKCTRKSGVDAIKWGEITNQHSIYVNLLTNSSDSTHMPTQLELSIVLDSLVASRALLLEEGVVVSRKGTSERKVMLLLEKSEVERVLGEVGGEKWKNALGTG